MNPTFDEIKQPSNTKQIDSQRNKLLSDTTYFVGRQTELESLLKHISPKYRQHITVVDGIAGIGKTLLVMRAAYLCQNTSKKPEFLSHVKIPIFEAIIFVSLKEMFLHIHNEVKQAYKNSGLQYIFRIIASELKKNTEQIHKTLDKEQIEAVYQRLNQQDTLLIIDDLESAKGKEQDDILLFLSNLPPKVQAIIITRNQVVSYSPISLDVLRQEEGLQLIKQQAEKKGLALTVKESLEIYNTSEGIPLAIVYLIGQKKIDLRTNVCFIKEIDKTSKHKTFLLFKKSLELLNNQFEHQILKSISFFPNFPSPEAIAEVAGFEVNSVEIKDGVKKLEDLSLIEQQETRYSMHPVTCEYVAKELSPNYDFEKDARSRWVLWYINFAKKYGGRDWENWRNKYEQLEIEWDNLLGVLDWCATNGFYEKVRDLWENLNQFANLEDYWHERLFWLNWLTEESQKREEWNTASYCMSEKGFTLIQLGNYSAAEDLLNQAFDLEKAFDLSSQENSENRILICQHFALLYICQEKYIEAFEWLEEEKSCLEKLIKSESSNVKKNEVIRRKIAINTLEAEILFRQDNYEDAEEKYKEIVKKSAQIGWQRRKEQAQQRINAIQLKTSHTDSRQIKRDKYIDSSNHHMKPENKFKNYINLYG